jgi:DNA-binding CsgD family transcriptional regulator
MSVQPDDPDDRDKPRGLVPTPDGPDPHAEAEARAHDGRQATTQAGAPRPAPPPAPAPPAAPGASQSPAGPPVTALLAALDQLAHPILALKADGGLVYANEAGRDLLAGGWPFVLDESRRVQPRQSTQRSAFVEALKAAAAGQPQPLHCVDGQRSLHGVLRPLDPLEAAQSQHRTPAPVMMVLTPPADTRYDASGFANTYQLSRAETRVLEVLLHGGQAEDAAARLGVGVATVRSQIAAIRKKANHTSVASLLAALGDLPPLRRSDPSEGK